jgi:3',5'-cyclic AMP phosphodiesterase CpdA
MLSPRKSSSRTLSLLCLTAILLALAGYAKNSAAQTSVDLQLNLTDPFRFVAYGDSRFHDPRDTSVANPQVRVALVQAIAQVNPAFICFTGDLVYKGDDSSDWKIWDDETAIWRQKKIPVYPALGNHELNGNENVALGNYFQRFPELNNNRYYSVRAANALILALDSSLDQPGGPQEQWLLKKLDNIPTDVDFVFLMFHHPPYTSSSGMFGSGHSARSTEQHLAKLLEERQTRVRAQFIVFSGHVHNYERFKHGGVTYFVSGGGGAHAYPIARNRDDPFQSKQINYHYLLVEVDHQQLKITMNRLELNGGKESWSQPDSLKITLPAATPESDGTR